MYLIFGCGYLGSRVARLWQAAGHAVHVVTRSPARAAELSAAGYTPHVADVTRPETIAAALSGISHLQTVLFAVGYDRSKAQEGNPPAPSIHEVYADGFSAVLAALPDDTARAIYISTTGVYGQSGGAIVDEESPTEPRREGGRASLAAEAALAASPFASRGIVLRMAGLYGPGRIPLADALRRGEPIPAPAEGSLNLIHIDDAARVVVAAEALDLTAHPGPRVYNVSDGHPAVRRAYYEELARLLAAPAPRFTTPAADSPAASRATTNKRISNARLLRELDVQLEYPTYREGLAAILRAEPS